MSKTASRLIRWRIVLLGATVAGLVAEIYGIPILFAVGGIASSFMLLLFLNRVPSQLLQNLNNNAE